MKNVFFLGLILLVSSSFVYAVDDGTYDATVTTDSGSYTVPVEVESGEVTSVHWPNGGDMTVNGADVDDNGEASGQNSRGDNIDIQIDE